MQLAGLISAKGERAGARRELEEVLSDDAHAPAFQRRRDRVWMRSGRSGPQSRITEEFLLETACHWRVIDQEYWDMSAHCVNRERKPWVRVDRSAKP